MSLLNKASLIQIPSGYKDGTLYSAKPTNGDGDFTFSRGSNLAATRVNSEGLIEKGRENLVLHSNTFSNAVWAGASTTETGGQSGYDGTNDAWLLTKIVANGNISQSVSASNLMTFSVYAKASANDWLRLNIVGVANAYFDLANGVVGSTGGSAAITSAMIDAGGGWYRCSFTYNVASTTGVSIYVADADNDSSGTSGSIFIQDSQLESGLISTPYIETGASTAQAGILEDMPRLDYSGGTCPSLLLEPQRTNAFPQSEYPSTSTLNLVNGGYTWTHNQTNSPEGIQNASKWAAANNNAVVGVYQNFSATSGASYTFSVFAKKGDHNFIQLQNGGGGSGANSYANFDLENGTKSDGATITDSFINDFGNGWYRIGITFTTSLTSTSNCSIDIIDSLSAGRNSTFTGSVGDYFYIWGMQVEQGSYVSSYIPTYGASVTRGADSCSKTGISSLIGQTEGTLFLDFVLDSVDGGNDFRFDITEGSSFDNEIFIGMTNGDLRALIRESASNVYDSGNISATVGTRYKMALAYANNDVAFYINGTQEDTSSSATIPNTDEITIGNRTDSKAMVIKESLNQALLFPTRLTNDELASLTTI